MVLPAFSIFDLIFFLLFFLPDIVLVTEPWEWWFSLLLVMGYELFPILLIPVGLNVDQLVSLHFDLKIPFCLGGTDRCVPMLEEEQVGHLER